MKRFQRMAAVLALLAFVLAAGYLFYTCRQSSDIPRPEAEIRESGFFSGNRNTYVRGGGKRVPLYMFDGQKIGGKAINSFQAFIGWIAFPVYRGKLLPKLCGCKHTELLSDIFL